MQIIAGKFKGRHIKFPKGRTRPTSGRVREAIFDVLGATVEGADAIELFCGSGALGLEALSRGARSCIFVDKNRAALTVVKQNIESLGIMENAKVVLSDAVDFLRNLNRMGQRVVLFVDPPYHKGLGAECLLCLDGCGILTAESSAVIEHHRKESMPDEAGCLYMLSLIHI
jgi:16S rRNA (guanine(966)-N(2))-methyltransferase RsmD